MDIVARPEIYPGHCIATLKHEDPKGFVDTGVTPAVVDPKVYVSVSWLEECAYKLGWTSPEDRSVLEDEMARMRDRVTEVEAELAEADRFEEAARYTLSRFDAKVRNKPGRKPIDREAA